MGSSQLILGIALMSPAIIVFLAILIATAPKPKWLSTLSLLLVVVILSMFVAGAVMIQNWIDAYNLTR